MRPRTSHRVSAVAASPGLSQYDQLSKLTTIVEDTGEINQIAAHKPYAATTNPSLVAKAADLPEYASVVEDAIKYGKGKAVSQDAALSITRNYLFTQFGARILEHIPGDVSTEVDARLSFDVQGQIDTALELIKMYEESGISKDRVLIKLATTWEGVEACRALEEMGIRTNMTLLFSMAQAAAAAEAGAFLISPFVGRILDWYKAKEGREYSADEDPGVISVRNIYNYYKCCDYKTIVMGASFRSKEEILALAGCDRLTIAPKFIASMKDTFHPVGNIMTIPDQTQCNFDRQPLDEKAFRWEMNQDAMATEKLAEGIRGFAADLEKLDAKLRKLML